MSRQRLVFLGDSITQYASMPNGWINLLSERFVREYDFVNRGFSGYNTRWMLGMASKIHIKLREVQDAYICSRNYGQVIKTFFLLCAE